MLCNRILGFLIVEKKRLKEFGWLDDGNIESNPQYP